MRPLEPYVFLIDRCLGRKSVPEAMLKHIRKNERIVLLDEHFPQNTADEVWIPSVGSKGWIILTKDENIQRRPNEQSAFVAASTAVFVFTRGGVKGDRSAQSIVTALPRIREAVRRYEVPLLGRINLSGEVTVAVESGKRLDTPKRVTKKK